MTVRADAATAVVDSPVGPLTVMADESVVLGVRFASARGSAAAAALVPGSVADRAAVQLAQYFAGARTEFDVPLDWARLDPGASQVLTTLLRIAPYGHTVSYGELAAAAGVDELVPARAVGQILNANPWPVVVPCHRVVMADGSLGGFGGGGWRKEILLRLEGALPATLFG
jgi:methylated-DNA-[protein]-cysteine S-methyltransferase